MMTPKTNGSTTGGRVGLTAWIPRLIRCKHCGSLAHYEVQERKSDDDVAVRFVCDECHRYQMRHFHDSDYNMAA